MAEQNLTVAQVAERINYSTAQVRTLLRNGKLKGTRAGDRGKWQISETNVTEFIGAKTDETESTKPPVTEIKEQEQSTTTEIKPPESKKKPDETPPVVETPPTPKGKGASNFPLGEAILGFFRR